MSSISSGIAESLHGNRGSVEGVEALNASERDELFGRIKKALGGRCEAAFGTADV